MTIARTFALLWALALSACASSQPGTARGAEWGPWGPTVRGVRCRVKAPFVAKQGDVLSIAIELDVIEGELPHGRHLLDPDLRRRRFSLLLVHPDGQKIEVRPYDPYDGMLPDYMLLPNGTIDPSNDLLAPESRAFSIDFPLATEWEMIEPGVHKAHLRLAFEPRRATQWKADVVSQPFEIRIDRSRLHEEVFLLPKTLRVEGGRVTYHTADAEEVRLATRNGFFIGARIDADGGNGMKMSLGPVPTPDDVNPIDAAYSAMQRLASAYTITVFETAEAPVHMWMPSPGSGGYRELWRRTLEPVR